jgi:septal ring factor EnvC (AmiA/AmiB activator)
VAGKKQGITWASNAAAHATVTETAVLRSQVEDLKNDLTSLDQIVSKLMTDLDESEALIADQQNQIDALRRQVRALRDGAILEDEP